MISVYGICRCLCPCCNNRVQSAGLKCIVIPLLHVQCTAWALNCLRLRSSHHLLLPLLLVVVWCPRSWSLPLPTTACVAGVCCLVKAFTALACLSRQVKHAPPLLRGICSQLPLMLLVSQGVL